MTRGATAGSHECGGDAAPYVLGALEPMEEEAFRRHVAGCAICRDEVDVLAGVVQALPMAAPQHRAPRGLRHRVMKAIRRQSHIRQQKLGRLELRIAPRAAVGVLGAVALAAAATIVIVAPGSRTPVVRVIQANVSGSAGSAELRISSGRGELIVHRLSPPPPGHVYEVWLREPHRPPAPASVLFGVNSRGAADVGLPESLRGVTEVMVTSEPDGGSLVPTHSPVIVAQLT